VKLPVKGEHAAESETGEGKGLVEIRRALLLKGNPKTRKSSSYSLGGYLFEQMGARAIDTETIYLHTVLRNPQKWQVLLEAVEVADLVTLAFPLYCDSLPAPVAEAFEHITTYRQGRDPVRRQLFSAIAKPLNIEDFTDLIARIINGEHVWYIA